MPVSVSFIGSNITQADSLTGWSVLKLSAGGSTPSPVLEQDVVKTGSAAISVRVSNQYIVLWYDNGTGINWTTTAANQRVYIWCNMLAGGLLASRSTGGLGIVLGSTTTNYSIWYVDGFQTYPGGWVRYFVTPTQTPSITNGTGVSLTSVRYFGMSCDTRPNAAKFDNLVIDRIDRGTGLRVTGTSNPGALMTEVSSEDRFNGFGIVNTVGGVHYLRGSLILGDDVGTTSSNMSDENSIVVIDTLRYHRTIALPNELMEPNAFEFKLVGNSTGTTNIQFGQPVGSTEADLSGRSGLTLVSTGQPTVVDFDNGLVTSAKIYGSVFRNITNNADNSIGWGTNALHEMMGCTFDSCITFMPGAAKIRDVTIINAETGISWGPTSNIRNLSLIACTTGVSLSGSFLDNIVNFYRITFSGCTTDVQYSGTAAITVNALDGSNPTTTFVTGGGSLTIVNAVVFQVVNIISGTEVRIYRQSDMVELAGAEDVSASPSGLFNCSVDADPDNPGRFRLTYTYNYTSDVPVFVVLHNLNYQWARPTAVLRSTASSVTAQQVLDRQYGTVLSTAETVAISDASVSSIALSPLTSTVEFSLLADGNITETDNGGTPTVIGQWVTNLVDPSQYEARMTVNSGTIGGTSTGTWVNLGVNRTWTVSRDGALAGGTSNASALLEIRRAGVVQDSATITFGAQVTGPAVAAGTPASLLGPASLTQHVSATADDANFQVTIPFPFLFDGVDYGQGANGGVYIVSNSYITFGYSSTAFNNFTASAPGRGIFIGTADNSWQRLYSGTETVNGTTVFRVRFEGTAATSGTPGSPNMEWEITFYPNHKMQVVIGTMSRTTGVEQISNGTAYTAFPQDANTSYYIDASTTGTSWTTGVGSIVIT